MKKILFACDLDNTLIHSYRKKKEGDVCVEWLNGNEQGFISGTVRDEMAGLQKYVDLIPVTTRSIEQYLRIRWKEDAVPAYAITTNGAIALRRELVDESWREVSERMVSRYKEELVRILAELEKEDDYRVCRIVDSMYVFASCKDGVDIAGKVKAYSSRTVLHVVASGRKIYFLPPEFNKGHALQRLIRQQAPDVVLAAGDSEMDIPMLELADLAFCKKEIFDSIQNPKKRLFRDEMDLLSSVRNFLEEIG
uniref:Putative HAD superfamily hydrolase n=1 Tax=Eubacterium cellulosolvens (strain ATCC 43171 / JCM 9499 / 6) TaxID=633697 RepID=I5AXG9_EUBC6